MLILSLLNNHLCAMILNFCKYKRYITCYDWSALFNYKTTIYIQRYLLNKTEWMKNSRDIKIYAETGTFCCFSKNRKDRQKPRSKVMFLLSFPRCSNNIHCFLAFIDKEAIYCHGGGRNIQSTKTINIDTSTWVSGH